MADESQQHEGGPQATSGDVGDRARARDPDASAPTGAGAPASADSGEGGASRFDYPALKPEGRAEAVDGLSLLSDVNLNVTIELGRTAMLVEDVLELGEGSVVELDKLAGDPVDIYVNDKPVARGEVLVLNENFCVRVSEILAPMMVDQSSEEPTTEQEAA